MAHKKNTAGSKAKTFTISKMPLKNNARTVSIDSIFSRGIKFSNALREINPILLKITDTNLLRRLISTLIKPTLSNLCCVVNSRCKLALNQMTKKNEASFLRDYLYLMNLSSTTSQWLKRWF